MDIKGLGPAEAYQKSNLKDILSHETEDNVNINVFQSHTCEYFEPNQIQNFHSKTGFFIYSHNVRSLSGNFDNFYKIQCYL